MIIYSRLPDTAKHSIITDGVQCCSISLHLLNILKRYVITVMKNDSSTVLEREDSAEKFPARNPIFQLVRPAVVVGCLYILLIGLDFLINHHNALYYVHHGSRFAVNVTH